MQSEMTLRDHFAAAALTGLLARRDCYDHEIAILAWDMAEAMLRCRPGGDCPSPDNAPNLDASPEARASEATASPERVCVRSDAGTGDTPVAEPMPQEKQAEVSDRSKPITGPDPDLRVWGTHTHAAHATQGEGSEPRDGTQEPVAWGVANGSRVLATSISRMDAVDMQGDYAYRTDIVPLYRSPTLTDAEAETLRELRDEAAQYADEIGLCASEVRGRQRIIDGLLVRLGGER